MSLENRYRRLLRTYPRAFRERRGEEMVATLLDSAAPGQTRPTRLETLDLLASATRERLGLHAVPSLDAGLRLAGPVALVLATATAFDGWWIGERGPASTPVGWPGHGRPS